jgi:cobyrinic acid a,c-diamide synthase
MVLGESLADADGVVHPMAGLLPVATSFAMPKLHLGYRHARVVEAGPLGMRNAVYAGHEFHYATVEREAGDAVLFRAKDARGNDLAGVGRRNGRVMGSFLHLISAA